jgi:hypothetical protein
LLGAIAALQAQQGGGVAQDYQGQRFLGDARQAPVDFQDALYLLVGQAAGLIPIGGLAGSPLRQTIDEERENEGLRRDARRGAKAVQGGGESQSTQAPRASQRIWPHLRCFKSCGGTPRYRRARKKA